jgi:hypothetical protein
MEECPFCGNDMHVIERVDKIIQDDPYNHKIGQFSIAEYTSTYSNTTKWKCDMCNSILLVPWLE